MIKTKRLPLFCLLLLLLAGTFSQAATFATNDKKFLEVRVLVDVSKNMKFSDPDNHRLAALKLFVNLLPNNAIASIWMFDDKTTEIMKASTSGISWKSQALKNLNKIHSDGKTSDIERALAVASLEWVTEDKNANRHIVLLTEGKVLSGATKAKSLASKERVLNHQIARLKAADVSVHTIGFSKEADKEFLDEMANQTSGWSELINTADQLERAVLRVSKRLVEKNSIPLVANKFLVDETVREFTAVVFRKKGFSVTQLDDPEGLDFGGSSKRLGVRWHREKSYDIVTVSKPMEGEWRLIAPADPDNEVFITTNLQMVVENIPKEIYLGSGMRIKMLFSDRGKLLKSLSFLGVINATIELTDKRNEKEVIKMEQDMINGGYFFADIGKDLKIGPYKVVVKAVSDTFERIETLSFHVKAKPRVEYVEIMPEFKQVLADAGIVLPKEGMTEAQILECPDLSKIVVGGSGLSAMNEIEDTVVEEESNWLLTSGVVLLVNLLLAAGGFFGYKAYKKKVADEDEDLVNKLSL
ncbi:MAG: vWA domain-containing protein [Cycloclasticus sp.]|nr:vWA domain-containing protein [Cycloclasticus sp.]